MSHNLTEFEPLAGPLGLELVDESTEGAGHRETQVSALFDVSLQLGLKMTNEALVSRIAQKFTGRLDIQTGNAELDKAIHLEGQDADAARSLLADSGIQQLLLDAYAKYPNPVITDTTAELVHYGLQTDVES